MQALTDTLLRDVAHETDLRALVLIHKSHRGSPVLCRRMGARVHEWRTQPRVHQRERKSIRGEWRVVGIRVRAWRMRPDESGGWVVGM